MFLLTVYIVRSLYNNTSICVFLEMFVSVNYKGVIRE